MAYGKIPNEGELQLAKLAFGQASPENLVLKLFTDANAPADTDTASTHTEMTAAGYAAATLTSGSWTIATDGNGVAMATYAEQTFTMTAGTDCYGYELIGATSGKLYVVHGFGGNYKLPDNGGVIKITPKLGFVSKES
jgi:hypothetical protein